MELEKFDEKHVRVADIYGDIFTGVADFYDLEYTREEFGKEDESIIIGEYLILKSQIASIEEMEVHGTAELRTEHLILRRVRPDDASDLYREFGTDPEMFQYTGWNPYATEAMAQETVQQFIAGYDDEHFYGWVMDFEDVLIGTIGAYDYHDDQIEVGFSVVKACWGRGYATEALKAVLKYLMENERISRVTAWCSSENMGSRRVMERAGMKPVHTEKHGLAAGGREYDKITYEYNETGNQKTRER